MAGQQWGRTTLASPTTLSGPSMIVSVTRAGGAWWGRGEWWGPRHPCSTETWDFTVTTTLLTSPPPLLSSTGLFLNISPGTGWAPPSDCRTGERATTLQTTACPYPGAHWGDSQPCLPVQSVFSHYRPEIHLAHNPLDTLHEEDAGYPDPAFDILNQSTSSAKILPISDNSESSGRGSSSSGSARERLWTAPTSSPSSCNGGINGKKSFPNTCARESPDEGIQTDSGTDV